MLITIAIILAILWALGLIGHLGGLINILLVLALISIIAHFFRGRRAPLLFFCRERVLTCGVL